MYLTRFALQNIRAIRALEWKVPLRRAPGWHVILGDNGSGKSSVLRAIALGLVGVDEAMALRQDFARWLRADSPAFINLRLAPDARLDKQSTPRSRPLPKELELQLGINRQDGQVILSARAIYMSKGSPLVDLKRLIWGAGDGWFCASYGPFRRFTGGDEAYDKLFSTNPRLARHLSVFDESVALTEGLRWLQQLKFKELEDEPEGRLLAPLMQFINQPGFLPHQARLESISSREVLFMDGNGFRVPVEELSDGYRSILSMTLELIRQLATSYGPQRVFDPKDPTKIKLPGVVLIDEVDAHLHPTWQRRVGLWFREHFPKLQFIVTTHSPLVCHAAEVGTVWRLPRPGSDEVARQVTGVELDRLIYGNVLDAYGTGLFGEGVSRSSASKQRLERLAELNLKEVRKGLTAAERKEQAALRASHPTAPMTFHDSGGRGSR